MHRTPVRAFWATLALAVALGLWTWLSLSTAAFAAWDASALRPGIDLWSIAGQVAAAVAVLTWPGVTYSVLVVVGVWVLVGVYVAVLVAVIVGAGVVAVRVGVTDGPG